jgi:hypothetical protein
MNFDEAISAHSGWKAKLKLYLAKPDHSLKANEVGAADQCVLGRWMVGEGRKFAAFPEFAKLTAEHTHFHKAAASVVGRADAGDNVSEEVALGAKSEFAQASSQVVAAIMELKRKV